MTRLECAYYWSQIILTGIAGVAAIGAYLQIQASNKFEMLKILEAPRVRKARRLLYKKACRRPRADDVVEIRR